MTQPEKYLSPKEEFALFFAIIVWDFFAFLIIKTLYKNTPGYLDVYTTIIITILSTLLAFFTSKGTIKENIPFVIVLYLTMLALKISLYFSLTALTIIAILTLIIVFNFMAVRYNVKYDITGNENIKYRKVCAEILSMTSLLTISIKIIDDLFGGIQGEFHEATKQLSPFVNMGVWAMLFIAIGFKLQIAIFEYKEELSKKNAQR